MITAIEIYINETNSLNKVSKKQRYVSLGSGFVVGILGRKIGNYNLTRQTGESLANIWFDNKRNEKKEAFILSSKEFQIQMKNKDLINSSISIMDRYIDMTSKNAEIVSIEGEYYIKYSDKE